MDTKETPPWCLRRQMGVTFAMPSTAKVAQENVAVFTFAVSEVALDSTVLVNIVPTRVAPRPAQAAAISGSTPATIFYTLDILQWQLL